jgi:hypothetical protein
MIDEVRFAVDSLVEGAVHCELVSETTISGLLGIRLRFRWGFGR